MTTPSSTNGNSKSTSSRMPSLNQLAARMTIKEKDKGDPVGAARPRLAASILRTTSSASLASSADSTAVQPSTTRSASPTNDDPPESSDITSSESVESPNAKPKLVKGYKNIPSLDAITARLAKTRALSIDGTPKPPEPEPELIEDPKTPGIFIPVKEKEHPLQYTWTIYHDSKANKLYTPAPNSANPTGAAPLLGDAPPSAPPSATLPPTESSEGYEAGLTVIGSFSTVEQFCRYFNWLKPPSHLERNSNYHLFKEGIKPMWEDPANENGGKWVLTIKSAPPSAESLLDRSWSYLCMALVGEELEADFGDEICGAVVSVRAKVDRIQLWTRSKDSVERLNAIGKRLVKLLDVGEADGIGLEFQFNTSTHTAEDRAVLTKFLSIQSAPGTGYGGRFGPGVTPTVAHAHGPAATFGGHAHSRSIGGMGVGPGIAITPVEQPAPPLSAGAEAPAPPTIGGAGTAFGGFGVPLGAGAPGGAWRRR